MSLAVKGLASVRLAFSPDVELLPHLPLIFWSGGATRAQAGEISMSKALLYDATICIGCKQCEAARVPNRTNFPTTDAVARGRDSIGT